MSNNNKLNYNILYKQVYDFHKKWYNINKNDSKGFEDMNTEANEISNMYNNEFVDDMLVAVLYDIKRKE